MAVAGGFFAALLSFVAACGERAPEPPFNVILISIDTLRADHVGAYGYALPTTPEIDSFAKDALLFSRCVAHAPTTLASHASIMTSLLPRHHGASIARRTRLADGIPTLAQVLRSHGYATASFNGGIQLDAVYGLDRGFEVYSSVKSRRERASALTGNEDRLDHGVDETIRWVGSAERPFFVFLHSYEVHHPYTPDPKTLAIFDGGYEGDLPDHISVGLLKQINRGRLAITKADEAHIVHAYDAEIRSADRAVGRLIAHLRESDLYERTLIVVTSDHGEEFRERGKMGWHAHSLFEELLQVPLIVRFPGSRFAGEVEPRVARGIDIAPTVLAALGIDAPDGFSGRDLAADLESPAAPPRPALSMFDTLARPARWSLSARGWKLQRVAGQQLFDLGNDPGERTNVLDQHRERVAELERQAADLLDSRPTPKDVAASFRRDVDEQLRALGYVD